MTKAALKPPMAADLYETDFYAWARGQAQAWQRASGARSTSRI